MTDTIELTVQNVSKELAETLAKESELCLATLDETVIAVLREQLEPLVHDTLMATCAAFRVAMVDSPGTAAKKALRFLAQRVLGLDPEIAALMDDLN